MFNKAFELAFGYTFGIGLALFILVVLFAIIGWFDRK